MKGVSKYIRLLFTLCYKKSLNLNPKKADVHLEESRLLGAIANYDEGKKTSFEYGIGI